MNMLWAVVSSTRSTAILAILLTLTAGVIAVVPQGPEAMELMSLEGTEGLRRLAAWGLSDVFASAWIKALGVLLVGNMVAVTLRGILGARAARGPIDRLPNGPHRADLDAKQPERAVEVLRETLLAKLGGAPVAESVDGSRVTMIFETGRSADFAPMMAHLGLVVLVVGAGLASMPPPPAKSAVHAVLEVKDSRTGFVGVFNLAVNEPVEFFRWRASYVIRDFVRSKDGLGPAIRIEQIFQEEQRSDDFWIYLNAPPGFDERHRRGVVAIEARSMGLRPLPGEGLASSPGSILMMLGVALLGFGLVAGAVPRGRLWVEADGEAVKLCGVPERASDPAFGRAFVEWTGIARTAVAEEW